MTVVPMPPPYPRCPFRNQLLVVTTALMALTVVLFRPSKSVVGEDRASRHHSTVRQLVELGSDDES